MNIINEITIKGFKSIHEQTISLGQLNVFIGTNGAGKSNILEALAMLSASAEGGIDYQKLSARGSRLSSPNVFRSAFLKKRRKKFFELDIKISNYKYSMKVNANSDFSYFSESLKEGNKMLAGRSHAGATLNKSSINKLESHKSIIGLTQNFENSYNTIIENLRNFAIYAPATPILRGVTGDQSFNEPLGLYGGKLAQALKTIITNKTNKDELQRFFKLFDWFKSIGTTSSQRTQIAPKQDLLGDIVVNYRDKFMSKAFDELFAYDVSEGALYVLFVIVLIIHEKSPNIFALDNIDSTLNPGLVRNLMLHIVELLNKNQNKQIFLTTHNPTTLDAIDLFNNKHRLFVVSRSETGETVIKRIEPPQGMTKEQWENEYAGFKLSEIWLSGAIGGLAKGF